MSVSLGDWIARDAIPFDLVSLESLHRAVDQLIGVLGDSVRLLAFGEAMHGATDLLMLRNRLFQRLVEAHGYSAIAVESSFPRGHAVNEYVAGRGPQSYEAIQDVGFSHGFGRLDANRELVEWMRQYNVTRPDRPPLRFYGFDSPTEMMGTDSPRQCLHFALEYLAVFDDAAVRQRRMRIDALLGDDVAWENPAAMFDPTKSIGGSPEATALRIETEDLITELGRRRPELVAAGEEDRYLEAMQHASLARQLLTYHATVARPSSTRTAELLGIRDLMMAENLAYMARREQRRGKVFAFAHNMHLQRGQAAWQLGPDLLTWWPAGAQVARMLGQAYAVIGSGVAMSESQGIGPPESGTLEAQLTIAPGPARFIPTHRGRNYTADEVAGLPTRSASATNSTYLALTPRSLSDFDALMILDSLA